MIHLTADPKQPKGWFAGPWNSSVPAAVGYANEGINIRHYHETMYEIYLVAQGESVAIVDGKRVALKARDLLVVEPGEVHTFVESTADYFHFVIQTPFVPGDKRLADGTEDHANQVTVTTNPTPTLPDIREGDLCASPARGGGWEGVTW